MFGSRLTLRLGALAGALVALLAVSLSVVASSAPAIPPTNPACLSSAENGTAQNCSDPVAEANQTAPEPAKSPQPEPSRSSSSSPEPIWGLGPTFDECAWRGTMLCGALGTRYSNGYVAVFCEAQYVVMCKRLYPR